MVYLRHCFSLIFRILSSLRSLREIFSRFRKIFFQLLVIFFIHFGILQARTASDLFQMNWFYELSYLISVNRSDVPKEIVRGCFFEQRFCLAFEITLVNSQAYFV